MNFSRKLIFFILVCFGIFKNSSSIASESNSLKNFYGTVYLGEKKLPSYFGPIDSQAIINPQSGDIAFKDDLFAAKYLNSSIQNEPFDLHSFWFNQIKEKSNCPDVVLAENLDYIRYLYRLVTISYLVEEMKLNFKLSQQLASKNSCSLDFKELFGACKPISSDMRKFHERAYGKFINDYTKIRPNSFSPSETSAWLSSFYKTNSLTIDPVFARFHDWCSESKKNCKTTSLEELKSSLDLFCRNDREIIEKLCSESDSLYGISYADKATELIQSSNAFNLINQTGMGEDCLRRYVKVFTPKEFKYSILTRIFPLINSMLAKENSRYMQGDLFLPGALKEFDMKGLSDFLVALKPPKIEPVKIVIKAKPKPKPTPKPAIIAKPEIPVKIEPKVIVEPPKPEEPKLSEFERVVKEIQEKKMESLSINMEKFREDYEFTPQWINDLSAPIKKFQTRSALQDMKSYDHLGAKEAPLGLVFLKFLIDTENHQGLYNIQSVIGDRFYVYNDFESKDRPIFIELKNDASTKNHWQIVVINSLKQSH